MSANTAILDKVFPLPSDAPSTHSPSRSPAVTHASSDVLLRVLKDNHVRWHAFFNDKGFHNHASHHLLAIYALGAAGPLIEAAYQTHVVYMRPAFQSPEAIDEGNFWKHLGHRDFYNSYLEYFKTLLLKKDVTDVLEEYVFSAKANVGGNGVEGQPRMLNRFLAGALHPLIHAGYGLEFGLLGLVAEGLAQAAVHETDGEHLVPLSLFDADSAGSAISRLTALLPSLTLNKSPHVHATATSKKGIHAFTVLARILADDKFVLGQSDKPANGFPPFALVEARFGSALAALTDEWAAELDGDGATVDNIARKIEEVTWMNTLIYGVGGWAGRDRSPTKKFTADFFYMHLVTSYIFLPSIVAYLSPRSASYLLRAYFTGCLAWYLTQGRPALPIRDFYSGTTASPTPPPPPSAAAPAKSTLTPDNPAPNAWLPLVQTTLVHPGEHVCKIQRALMHAAALYGGRAPGGADFAAAGLDGADALDGTLFVRVAGLTADRMGWMREGREEGHWDRTGFY